MVFLTQTSQCSAGDEQRFSPEKDRAEKPQRSERVSGGSPIFGDVGVTSSARPDFVSPNVTQEARKVLAWAIDFIVSTSLTSRPEPLAENPCARQLGTGNPEPTISRSGTICHRTHHTGPDSTVSWADLDKALYAILQKPSLINSKEDWRKDQHKSERMSKEAWLVILAHLMDLDETSPAADQDEHQGASPYCEAFPEADDSRSPGGDFSTWRTSINEYLRRLQSLPEDNTPPGRPFLQKICQSKKDVASASCPQSLFVVHSSTSVTSESKWVTENPLRYHVVDSHLIVNELIPRGKRLRLRTSINLGALMRPHMPHMAHKFDRVLHQLLESRRAQAKLDYVAGPSQKDLQVIWKWNASVPQPVEACVHDLIKSRAVLHPNKLAVDAWDGTLTYRQLDEQSTALALVLRDKGIGPGAIVPLCFERSMWMCVARVGVMKAGAASVGIDPKQPVERLRAITKQVRAPLILSSVATEDLVRRIGGCQVLVISRECLSTPPKTLQSELPRVSPSATLYAVFTSGSTGTPKGVLISHRNYSSAVAYQHRQCGFESASRVLDSASYAFDAACLIPFHTLTAGGCLCVPPEAQLQNDISTCIREFGITLLFLTPSAARLLEPDAYSQLDTLVVGGESVGPSDLPSSNSKTLVKVLYGPSECTPVATRYDLETSKHAAIGFGVGVCTWIVDPQDGRSLAPIGDVGELWLEGPLVGQGYLDDPAKTEASFIRDPPWLLKGCLGHTGRRGRLYRTGDLVRYNDDGSIVYVGRKDTQVKIRGQRVELGEVEEHVHAALQASRGEGPRLEAQVIAETIRLPEVDSVMLVVFLSLAGAGNQTEEEHNASVRVATKGLADYLAERVPAYMVPTAFIPVQSIPKTVVGKIDRSALRLLGASSWQLCRAEAVGDGEAELSSNTVERTLQEVWALVLNLPYMSVSVDRAFTSLGGDSITAMQVVSVCRQRNIRVAMTDILQARTIRNLASRCQDMTLTRGPGREWEEDNMETGLPFGLSPAQNLFFSTFPDGTNQLNRNLFLDIKSPLPTGDVCAALQAVVSRHEMLRARFQRDSSGNWEQFISPDVPGSFSFAEHSSVTASQLFDIAQARQSKLDIYNGPVFAGDLVNMTETTSQTLILTAHHLVVDSSSWKLIRNALEENFKSGRFCSESGPSYRAWCKAQQDVNVNLTLDSMPLFESPVVNLSWDLASVYNTRADSSKSSFILDHDATKLLMGTSNHSLRTEPLDIVLGSVAFSFHQAFPERSIPVIFLEHNGREESSPSSLDVSRTVGLFSEIRPLSIDLQSSSTIIDAVRLAKDTRRNVPVDLVSRQHGRSHWEAFSAYAGIELKVNFDDGRHQDQENDQTIFRLAAPLSQDRTPAVLPESSKRQATIEANMTVQDGKLVITFAYPKHVKHESRLLQWFQSFTGTLEMAARTVAQMPASLTLSDLPLLPLSYRALDRLFKQTLPLLGIKAEKIIDIYPTSPIQEGILLSSSTGISSYATFWIWSCKSNDSTIGVDPLRLEAAWRRVVERHSILSTVFCPSPKGTGFVQILLDSPPVRVSHMMVPSGSACEALGRLHRPTFGPSEPEHAFTICKSDDEVACRLDISHCLLDGASLSNLVKEIIAAYDPINVPPPAPFKSMIQFISSIRKDDLISFWSRMLRGVRPCEIPASRPRSDVHDTFQYIPIPSRLTSGISDACRRADVTRSVFLQVAWGMVLSHLTGMDEICFGYLASGRNAPVEGIEGIIGPLANMLVARINMRGSAAEIFKTTLDHSIEHLKHQHASLADVQHAIGLTGRRLFNTAMSVREADRREANETRSISLQYHNHQDPHEFDLLLTSHLERDKTHVSVQFRQASVGRQLAEEAAVTLGKAIEYLTSQFSHSSNRDEASKADGATNGGLYVDFFVHVVGSTQDATLNFWRGYFANLNAELFPSPKAAKGGLQVKSHTCTRLVKLRSSPDVYSAVEKVWAAWSIVAARNASSSEALFGAVETSSLQTVDSGQSTLPIRVTMDWKESGDELLRSIREQRTAMAPYKRSGLQVIRRASEECATACYNFQTLIITEESTETCQPLAKSRDPGTKAITIHCQIRAQEVSLEVRGCLNSLSEACITRVANQLQYAVGWISDTEARKSKLGRAIPITPQELDSIWSWNNPLLKANEECVHDLIKTKVLANPRAPAVCAWDGDLSYEQLDDRATRLACELTRRDIGRGSFVPLVFEKSMWMPVAMLAVMKAGAVSVALDTTQPEGRLRDILAWLDYRVALSSVQSENLAQSLGARHVMTVGALEPAALEPLQGQPQRLPFVRPSDILYAVFTSGSTGTPKGTLMTHQNMSTMVAYQQEALGLTSSSRVYDFASYAFDVAWCNFVHALTSGGCLCVPSEGDRRNDIEGSVLALRANYMHITPTILRHVDWSKAKTVSVINLSGEPVLPGDVASVGHQVKVVNAYGPAETNVVTVQDLTESPGSQVSIGRGAGACTWVVNTQDTNELASIGTIGELWVEGPLVGRGYLNDPERTAATFVKDPAWLLRGAPGWTGRQGTLYRTGDLVRYNDDGTLVYVGRADRQIKIRGQRVELGDVENQARRALNTKTDKSARNVGAGQGITEVVAETILPRQAKAAILVLFVSLEGAQAMTEQEHNAAVQRATAGLPERLSSVLPQYMVPSAYVPVRRMPLTATGKLDRRQLQQTHGSRTVQELTAPCRPAADGLRQPTTDGERLMQKLWAEALTVGAQDIGMDDDFFRVGGDSLGAMRLVGLARDKEVSVTVRDIFQHPVLCDLAAVIFSDKSKHFPGVDF
ncbi:hypothetical protein HIM_07449 [Hirsutella minnesotensis 3608]|uniref:Carrier domain-containing protein n=1 Tax=Hirsutella minnesotensis 3608 TaxID=1043627 RepID=A0A0F7ZYX9_9HYPO|nr:hypothetical protein HIM_07449 [Hirsutella minnesotensis 3608]